MYASPVRTLLRRATWTLGAAALAVALASPALAQTTVRCESKDGKRVSCPADTSQGVVLSKQLSSDGCWQNETWGTDAKGIWVSDHCAAEFMVSGGAKKSTASSQATAAEPKEEKKGGGKKKLLIGGAATAAVVTAIAVSGGDDDDDDNDRGYRYDGDGDIVRCESSKDRRTTCPVGSNTRVELVRQLSEADCRRGSTWGSNSDSIWVDNGCRGEFRVRSNDRNERVERNTRNDEARARAKSIDKNKAKERIKKEGGL
jgi:hypothetical protein